jgi:hypothetical protein
LHVFTREQANGNDLLVRHARSTRLA